KNNGFAKVDVSVEQNYTDLSMQNIDIEIKVVEGKRYKVGKIDFSGNKSFSSKKLLKILKLHKNQILKPKNIESAIERLIWFYYSETSFHPKIEPMIKYDDTKSIAEIVFVIEEYGEYEMVKKIEAEDYTISRVYVEDISFEDISFEKGHRVTSYELDYWLSGKKYTHRLVMRALEEIKNSHSWVKTVEYRLEKPFFSYFLEDNHILVCTKIKEKEQRGLLSVGLGYSSFYGFCATFGVKYFGLFDIGYESELDVEVAQKRNIISLSYFSPWNFGLPLRLTCKTEYNDEIFCYCEKKLRDEYKVVTFPCFSVTLLYKFFPSNLSTEITYSLAGKYLQDIESEYLKQRKERNIISSIEALFKYWSKDWYSIMRFLASTVGVGTAIKVAGGPLGGEVDFYELSLWVEGKMLPTPIPYCNLSFDIDCGWIESYGRSKEAPIYFRYFPGGRDVSGYDFWGQIGPYEGGNIKIVGSISLPVLLWEKGGLFFTPYFEFGNAWREPTDIVWKFSADDNAFKRTIGVSLGFLVLGLRYSKGLDAKPGEVSDYIHFFAKF
ncbi:MAG: BamA/TamA family outer membrane protein, partial [bacterium]|nr:BamA/TamA family outer membrane protein [bacterium]